jgi:hypothetical protein
VVGQAVEVIKQPFAAVTGAPLGGLNDHLVSLLQAAKQSVIEPPSTSSQQLSSSDILGSYSLH